MIGRAQPGPLHAEGKLSPQEIAARWGVTARTVQKLCQAGELRAVRIGSLWRVAPWALRQYEERHDTGRQAVAR